VGTITTDQIRVGQRGRFWEEAISDLYTKTTVKIKNPVNFYGRINWHKIGDVVLSDICSTRSVVARESRDIRPSADNLIQINFQLEGTGTVIQDGREVLTRPGEITLYDSARPYEMRFDGPFRQLSVDFPRALLQDRLNCSERVTARGFSGTDGPGRFLYSYVQSLVMGKSDGDLLIAKYLQENLMELLGTALVALGQAGPHKDSDTKTMVLSRVKAHIRANLSDVELSPVNTAKAHGLSLRKLHYLFENEGTTVSRFIQDSRLDQCRKEIEVGHMSERSICDIAMAWGFKDSAHFSRAFRTRFGLTPRECRAAGRALQDCA
jgi:AraC-like DNA-binding protein